MPHVIFNTPDELRCFVAHYPANNTHSFIQYALSTTFPIYFYYTDTSFTDRVSWQSNLNSHPGWMPKTDFQYACAILDPDSYPEYLL